MKRTAYIFAALFATLLLSCQKENQNIKIDEKELTGCPTGTTCQSLFTESADLSTNFSPKPGSNRLFWRWEANSFSTSTVYIKAPMAGNSFELNADDIRAGKVQLQFSCPACNYVALLPVGGYVKGINVTPGVIADKSKWLLEAHVLLGLNTGNGVSIKDTLNFKQYFYPNFVYN